MKGFFSFFSKSSLYQAITQLRHTQYIRELEQLEAQKEVGLKKQSQSWPLGTVLQSVMKPAAEQIKTFTKTT